MFPAQPDDILYKKERDSMLTLTSAKRVILLLVCLNVVTICTAVTIISSGMWVANAKQQGNSKSCSIGSVFHSFKNSGNYSGTMYDSSGKIKLGSMKLTFVGNPPTSKSDPGSFTSVTFDATALGSQPYQFQSIKGATGSSSHLSDFTVVGSDNQTTVQFIGGHFTGQGSQIIGTFTITGNAIDNGFTGTWKVS